MTELLDRVRTLPRFQAVALAARCARRVLPLLVSRSHDIPDSQVAAARFQSRHAETVAGLGRDLALEDPLLEQLEALNADLAKRDEHGAMAGAVAALAFRSALAKNEAVAGELAANALEAALELGEKLGGSAPGFLRYEIGEDLALLDDRARGAGAKPAAPAPGSIFPERLWPDPYPEWLCPSDRLRLVSVDEAQAYKGVFGEYQAARDDLVDAKLDGSIPALAQSVRSFELLFERFGPRPKLLYAWGTAHADIAYVYKLMGDYENAAEHAKVAVPLIANAIELNDLASAFGVRPKTLRADCYHNLGNARRMLDLRGEKDETGLQRILARIHYESALAINPKHEKVAKNLEKLLRRSDTPLDVPLDRFPIGSWILVHG